MLGSSLFVLPIWFVKYGMISCVIVALIMGLIQYKTCSLEITHFKPNETDL